MPKLFASAIASLALAGAVFTGWSLFSAPMPAHAQTMNVHKTPWCGCCAKWAEHLEENGFDVVIHEHEDLTPIRSELGVPGELQSCHTGEVNGYAVEGHVPAADIRRLLAEMPSARGLSVPGMPAGSPGMEMGDRVDAYEVILFGDDGQQVWASHGDAQDGAHGEGHAH
ncbi:DUF411 domain-containing protein [Thalassovita mediterranea]|nr:DUF411 domain-containing protein [Thalassovita mediterranea]